SVRFVWHGGEPLLRGRSFFEEIITEQERLPARPEFSNAVQTNATHLTEEMLDFLVGHDIRIGLSLDGPEVMNDHARRFHAPGKSRARSLPVLPNETFSESEAHSSSAFRSPHEITVEAARRLKNRGFTPGAIVVVSSINVNHPEEIYREFKDHGIHMQVNP